MSPNPPPPVDIAEEAEDVEEGEESEIPKKAASPVKAVPTKLTSKAIPVTKKVEPAKPSATTSKSYKQRFGETCIYLCSYR